MDQGVVPALELEAPNTTVRPHV